ncbi:MAG: trypsin-like peptidase domain-containing protein [Deltaproteobacteria bacterium]|nr:trypsin-like peptidase domain-containing protein [Deltaproteobacteria bacterium]
MNPRATLGAVERTARLVLIAITSTAFSCARPTAPQTPPPPCDRSAAPPDDRTSVTHDVLPESMAPALAASVVFHFGEQLRCSATKVGPRLLLSAAHCVVGYSGREPVARPRFERDGHAHPLAIAELGAFEPPAGKLADWVLLRTEDDRVLAGIDVAPIATPAEMSALLDVSDRLDERTRPVWAITSPGQTFRTPPRTPVAGPRLTSRGFIKSDRAYRQSIALALAQRVLYDDRWPGEPPPIPRDWELRWSSDGAGMVRGNYEQYRADGDPIAYHSADFAPGSSGGGVFSEDTGKLVGIIPFSSTLVSARDAYPGIGPMYRIDAICSRAEALPCPE